MSKLNIQSRRDVLVPVLHRLYCDCGRELELPQGVWHKQAFKWHYKCECGVQMQTSFVFPRIEYELTNEDGSVTKFTSSGYPLK